MRKGDEGGEVDGESPRPREREREREIDGEREREGDADRHTHMQTHRCCVHVRRQQIIVEQIVCNCIILHRQQLSQLRRRRNALLVAVKVRAGTTD